MLRWLLSYIMLQNLEDGMAKHYVVEKQGGASSSVFRDSKSGQFVTTVMSRKTFDKASVKANTAIREALGHGPKRK